MAESNAKSSSTNWWSRNMGLSKAETRPWVALRSIWRRCEPLTHRYTE